MASARMLLLVSFALGVYAYVGYPLILMIWTSLRSSRGEERSLADWPTLSISLPVFNEEANLRATLQGLLALDYPQEKVQIVVISDASTDRSDDIALEFSGANIELIRMPHRGGKTAAENAAIDRLRGEIVVNTDASVKVHPKALKYLVSAFADSGVGVASGCDVSTLRTGWESNFGESVYTGYEMWVRDLETRAGGIVGASGCLFAVRANLHRTRLPAQTFRDFAAPLIAKEQKYRSVSVREAICLVPRTPAFRSEYRRKVRTIARGIHTLLAHRSMLNPIRYGAFAWKLFSHKVCRWLVPWLLTGSLVMVLSTARNSTAALWLLAGIAIPVVLMTLAWFWPSGRTLPRGPALLASAIASNLAPLHAFFTVLLGDRSGIWEPTRRMSGDLSMRRDTGT